MRVLSRANRLMIFGCALIICAATERNVNAQSPALLVQLDVKRSVFYRDEGIPYSLLYDGGKSEGGGCRFGFGGQSVQLLRNGQLVYQEPLGPVSMTRTQHINNRDYASFGGTMLLSYAVPSQDINQKDDYQLRATCGDHVSPATKAFHIEPWAEPVDGLQVLIRPLKTEFRLGEPIRVEVTMRNSGPQARRCPVPLDDDGHPLNFWKLQPHWLDSREYLVEDAMYERSLKIMQPGESRRAVITLNHFEGTGVKKGEIFGSHEGKYQVWFDVFFDQDDGYFPAKYLPNLWRSDMSSNIIEVVVKK